jgi:hypothetical protein
MYKILYSEYNSLKTASVSINKCNDVRDMYMACVVLSYRNIDHLRSKDLWYVIIKRNLLNYVRS